MFRTISVVATTLTLVFLSCQTAATEDKGATGPEKLSEWQRLFRKHAAEYKIVANGDDKSEIKLVGEPVLHWSQPVRGGADGAVFLWTRDGRPMVIGTLFIWPASTDRVGVTHELHSLSEKPLTATWNSRKWTPPRNSVVWKSIPQAPVPGATPEARLRQMRELARQFQAESVDKNQRKWELRLLPRPVYRYELAVQKSSSGPDRDVLDGALFGFVEGTDLEVVMLLEARATKSGYEWQCAFARMSDFQLQASHGDQTVWKVDFGNFDIVDQPYCCSAVEYRPFVSEK